MPLAPPTSDAPLSGPTARPTQAWIRPMLDAFPESPQRARVKHLARALDAHLAKPTPRTGLLDAHRETGNQLWWRLNEEFEALERYHKQEERRQAVLLAAAAVVVMLTVGSLAVVGLV